MKKLIVLLILVSFMAGCMGTSAVSGKAKKFNLEVVEHRWAREGTFLAMTILWVYRICTAVDLLIVNSIEFWSGQNPINGKSPLVDLPMEHVKLIGFEGISNAKMEQICENEAKLHVDFENGDKMTFDVHRDQDTYTVSYLGKEFFKKELE